MGVAPLRGRSDLSGRSSMNPMPRFRSIPRPLAGTMDPGFRTRQLTSGLLGSVPGALAGMVLLDRAASVLGHAFPGPVEAWVCVAILFGWIAGSLVAARFFRAADARSPALCARAAQRRSWRRLAVMALVLLLLLASLFVVLTEGTVLLPAIYAI